MLYLSAFASGGRLEQSSLMSEPGFFGRLTGTEDQQLSRNLPGLQHQIRTAEVTSLMGWTAAGSQPLQCEDNHFWSTQSRHINVYVHVYVLYMYVFVCKYIFVIYIHPVSSIPLKNPD